MKTSTALLAFAVSILLTACQSVYRVPLDARAADNLESVPVSLTASQRLDAQIKGSNAGAIGGAGFGFIGGLVGGLVDAAVMKQQNDEKEKLIAQARDAWHEVPWVEPAANQLREAFSAVTWISDAPVTVVTTDGTASLNEHDFSGLRGTELFFFVSHRFSPDFRRVGFHVDCVLATTEKNLVPLGKAVKNGPIALYHNYCTIEIPLDVAPAEENGCLEAWVANDFERLLSAINLASGYLSKAFAHDLSPVSEKISSYPSEVILSEGPFSLWRLKDGGMAYRTLAL